MKNVFKLFRKASLNIKPISPESFLLLSVLTFFSMLFLAIVNWALFELLIYILIGTIIIFVLIYIFLNCFVVMLKDYERAIIFRLGKYNRTAGPGWVIVIPFFEEVYQRVDIRTQTLQLPEISAFTKNKITLKLSTVAYFRISDPYKAALKVKEYLLPLRTRLLGQIRNDIGKMFLWEVFVGIDTLNELLRDEMDIIAREWGLFIERIEILKVEPPEEIVLALYNPLVEEYRMVAARFQAEAKRVLLEAIGEAAKKFDERGIIALYLKALEQVAAGKSTKIVFPMIFTKFLENIKDHLKGLSDEEIQNFTQRIVRYLEGKNKG